MVLMMPKKLLLTHQKELGIKMVPFKFMVYVKKYKKYVTIDQIPKNIKYKSVSGTELRSLLNDGKKIPEWFTYPEVALELRKSILPKKSEGLLYFSQVYQVQENQP